MIRASLLCLLFTPLIFALPSQVDKTQGSERAKELKEFIRREKPQFEKREGQKKDISEELDKLNAQQNQVRQKIASLTSNQQELTMALDNLALEFQKQKELERIHRQQLLVLLKVAHKIKRDGVLRFVLFGDNLTQMVSRVRVLYRTLRSHSLLSRQFADRAQRIREAEERLSKAHRELDSVLADQHDQEALLNKLLGRKKEFLYAINQKQNSYQIALKEYKRVSTQVNTLFSGLESNKESEKTQIPQRGTLPFPVVGRIVQGFGKQVHQKFGTITYHKGIEIEAEHDSPVNAVLPGLIEYVGWVKGLGNVMILHHGGGFYSLNAHLFKTHKAQGARVEQGEAIGTVGDTGNSEKPSLYFELRSNSKAVDPLVYLAPSAVQALN
jgi:murein hydrolase activator